jgi:hypothetical protein
MRARKLSGLLVAGGLLLAIAAPAGADPKGDTFPIVCDNGVTYDATGNGNGEFTPAHDINSTSTLIPLSFGPFTGTVTDGEGNVTPIDEPASSKGQSGKQKDTVSCTFTFSGTDGEFTFEGSGSVVGIVTPRGK